MNERENLLLKIYDLQCMGIKRISSSSSLTIEELQIEYNIMKHNYEEAKLKYKLREIALLCLILSKSF